MVKFTEKLEANIRQPWAAHYIDYKGLQKVIKSLLASRPLDEARRWLFRFARGRGPVAAAQVPHALRKGWQKGTLHARSCSGSRAADAAARADAPRARETGSGRETGSARADQRLAAPSAPPSRPTSPGSAPRRSAHRRRPHRLGRRHQKEAKKKEKVAAARADGRRSTARRPRCTARSAPAQLRHPELHRLRQGVQEARRISPPVWEAARAELGALPFVRAAEVDALRSPSPPPSATATCRWRAPPSSSARARVAATLVLAAAAWR